MVAEGAIVDLELMAAPPGHQSRKGIEGWRNLLLWHPVPVARKRALAGVWALLTSKGGSLRAMHRGRRNLSKG